MVISRNDPEPSFLACSKPVFMSFSDTENVFSDVALLLRILEGNHFHLMIILANTVHS